MSNRQGFLQLVSLQHFSIYTLKRSYIGISNLKIWSSMKEVFFFEKLGFLHLTDLGIAKVLREDNFTDTSGTPGYMAPEVMCRQNHGF